MCISDAPDPTPRMCCLVVYGSLPSAEQLALNWHLNCLNLMFIPPPSCTGVLPGGVRQPALRGAAGPLGGGC